jgi:hypothetical protein
MTVGIADTTVIIHLFRKLPNARQWVDAFQGQLSVTPHHMAGSDAWRTW